MLSEFHKCLLHQRQVSCIQSVVIVEIAAAPSHQIVVVRIIHHGIRYGDRVVNDNRIDPMPVVMGAAQYPEGIIEDLKSRYKVIAIDAMSEAKKLGNPKVFNVIVLGLAAKHMDFTEEEWLKVIEDTVKPQFVEINKKAFAVGFAS